MKLGCGAFSCKRWANSGSHEFVKKNMVRYMRPHGRFAHCLCKNSVRHPPVLASCAHVMAKLSDLRYELVDRPPYSPDLAPCDFFLFPKLKVQLSDFRRMTKWKWLWKRRQIIFLWGYAGFRKTLEKMYWAGRRLCWKIKKNWDSMLRLSCSGRVLIDPPSYSHALLLFDLL